MLEYGFDIISTIKHRNGIEDIVEEVLKCHFDENELLIVLKSLQVRKYLDTILDDLATSQ